MFLKNEDLKIETGTINPKNSQVKRSWVRITHIPTGIVYETDKYCSQIRNRDWCLEKIEREMKLKGVS